MDGLKVKIELTPDHLSQSKFYNGWKHDHFVTSLLAFVLDGTIPAAFFNVPGCIHDPRQYKGRLGEFIGQARESLQ
jgi:hypothetical protein